MNSLLILLILIIITSHPLSAQESRTDTARATVPFSAIAQEFTSTLQGVLMAELKKGGAEGAVSVCSDTALKLSAEIGKKYNVEIRRISLKNRNPKNAPGNPAEKEMLMKMEQEHAMAVDNPTETPAPKKTQEGLNRFLSPIKVGAPCLQCHGSDEQIKPETLKKINTIYPGDKARNYKPGDFRGALVIERLP